MAMLGAISTGYKYVTRQTISPVIGHQFEWPQSRNIHIIGLVPSTLTLISTLVGIYWFCTMQRNFRISLILILIIADASKALWIFIFSVIGLTTNNDIKTNSAFCQVGGFFLQMSFEACDLAIFFLTLHVTLQILSPRWIPGSKDGLYGARRWVVVACVVLPMADALVPFSRYPQATAYTWDGAYCSLFLEPLAYTLSLSWIPRYSCWLFVLICISAVYVYTKSQSFNRRGSTTSQPSSFSLKLRPLAHLSYLCCTGPKKRMYPSSAPPSIDAEPSIGGQRRGSEFSAFTVHRANSRPQVKKLLLYPVVYIMLWSVPFAAQVISYSASRDVNSVYPIRAGSVFCVSIVGFFDVVIFSFRETPWKYNCRGDGTLHGSFNLFRFPTPFGSRRASMNPSMSSDPERGASIISRPHKTHNKGTDSSRRHAMNAYERLAMERAEAVLRPPMRRSTGSHALEPSIDGNDVGIDLEKLFEEESPILPSDLDVISPMSKIKGDGSIA